jgi:uncharacterized membrane-anchored protein
LGQTWREASAVKVPEVTLVFWLMKVAATTLGETAGDAVSMSLNLGHLGAKGLFAGLMALAVAAQIRAPRFSPYLYRGTIIASTTLGTTLADLVDRSLGIGYPGGSLLLLGMLVGCLAAWQRTLGTTAVDSVASPKAEVFYWMTIMFSQTLGTALGDWTADSAGLGYLGGMAIFSGLLGLIAAAHWGRSISRTALFWAAVVLTRPLGAVVGDFLDKPLSAGGVDLSRVGASAVLLAFIVLCVICFPQRPATVRH